MKKVFFILSLVAVKIALAQDVSPALEPVRHNTIKIDLTSHLLYKAPLVLSFERITKPNQSLGITLGYQEFPRFLRISDSIAVRKNEEERGLKFGAEYRFYLAKENKYLAPRGVYIGPYFAALHFNNERTLEVTRQDGTQDIVTSATKLTILNVGFQLGYQFVFNDRWTLDLVMIGPSMSNYRFSVDVDGTLSGDKDDITNEIILGLIDRFPFLDDLITDKEATATGKLDAWSYGYRYQFLIGYRFGKKR